MTKKREQATVAARYKLQITAARACKAINPDNPQAAADAIGDMYEELKYARKELLEFIEDNYEGTSLLAVHMRQLIPIDEAISTAEGK